jgi:hypothetical protein
MVMQFAFTYHQSFGILLNSLQSFCQIFLAQLDNQTCMYAISLSVGLSKNCSISSRMSFSKTSLDLESSLDF